jgi:hypothetical protein
VAALQEAPGGCAAFAVLDEARHATMRASRMAGASTRGSGTALPPLLLYARTRAGKRPAHEAYTMLGVSALQGEVGGKASLQREIIDRDFYPVGSIYFVATFLDNAGHST